jgi:hypothetical protein
MLVSNRTQRAYDSRWGWLLPSGVAWKLGRRPSRRRAALACFLDPLGFFTYRDAEALTLTEPPADA